ncbi:MAG: MFS transporter [Planctomycetes bacterium]|nr:MFS transporter [Planctomycetota bacterium]
MWSLSGAKRAIIIAGCLAAAYTQLTTSPATIRYARSIGATEFHIGILGAFPTLMLFMQFVSGVVVNHLHFRRRLWFWTAMAHRLLLLPTALGPFLIPGMSTQFWVLMLLATTALNQALLHFSSPLWLSWMGDYLPHQGLNQYWGSRQFWMQITAASSLAAAAFLVLKSGLDIEAGYAVLICLGTLCGVIDLLLFYRIAEPPVTRAPSPRLRQVLGAPFRNKDFRRYIRFMCYWNFAAMAGAPFISLYLMEVVGMDLFRVLLLWTISWVGGAMFSRTLGRWADHYGSRPVLVVCVASKSANMLALLFVPHNPVLAFWILAPIFMLDAAQNAGILIANNGFMIKHSPSENRTMYIAATQAVAGIVGGVTSIAAGWVMTQLAGRMLQIGSWTMGHFQMMFAASILLRWLALILVQTVREPKSHRTMTLVLDVLESFSWRRLVLKVEVEPVTERVLVEALDGSPISGEVPVPKFARTRRTPQTVRERL